MALNLDPRGSLLRDAIERARRSPFYARHLDGHALASRDDLARLPLTHKEHLRDESPYGMLAVPAARAWHYHESSGTTGEPISTWCGLDELRLMGSRVHEMVPELDEEIDHLVYKLYRLSPPEIATVEAHFATLEARAA